MNIEKVVMNYSDSEAVKAKQEAKIQLEHGDKETAQRVLAALEKRKSN